MHMVDNSSTIMVDNSYYMLCISFLEDHATAPTLMHEIVMVSGKDSTTIRISWMVSQSMHTL